jgi:hypothetical protein
MLAVARQLGLADTADGAKLGEGRRRLGGDLPQRCVVEDHIGGDALILGGGGAPGAELLEHRYCGIG